MFDLVPFGHEDRSIFHYLDNMEKNFFGDFSKGLAQFRTDILDQGDKYVLQAELPGFQKEDIHVDLRDGYLTITAEHKEECEEKKKEFIRRERKYGSFTRSFDVSGIRTEEISASYNNGVLELNLPKAQPENVPAARRIDIE